jgi:hypothetical protein
MLCIKKIVLLSFFAVILCAHIEGSTIKAINATVASIDDSVKAGLYSSLNINEETIAEGSPTKITLFFIGERIVLVTASVGHEIWLSKFNYYYYPNGQPMKYIKEIIDRPDNPPKQAILYNDSGNVIWKNIDAPIVQTTQMYELFAKLQKIRRELSGY